MKLAFFGTGLLGTAEQLIAAGHDLIVVDFDRANFPLEHLLKDVDLIRAAGIERGIATAPLDGVRAVLASALERGLGEKDYSSLYAAMFER